MAVEATDATVIARRAIVTMPPALGREIDFDPCAGAGRGPTLYRVAGGRARDQDVVVYDEPFWRADGLSGQTAGPGLGL